MNAKDALKTQFHYFYLTAKGNLDGMTAEQAVEQPQPGGNCASWILTHLVSVHNSAMGLVGADPVWADEAVEAIGDQPVTSAEQALDWDMLVSKLIDSEPRFMAAIEGLSDEQLDDEGFTDPFGNAATRGELLNLLAVHQNYHAGQLGLSRRLVGLEGAIRGPRPPEEASAA